MNFNKNISQKDDNGCETRNNLDVYIYRNWCGRLASTSEHCTDPMIYMISKSFLLPAIWAEVPHDNAVIICSGLSSTMTLQQLMHSLERGESAGISLPPHTDHHLTFLTQARNNPAH